MADRSNPSFGPAHKVLIDCMGFIVAERVRHTNRRMVFDLLAEALPTAHALDNSIIDKLILAAVEVVRADRALQQMQPNAALDWMAAHMTASNAFTDFSLWRAGFSVERMRASLATDGVVE